MMHIFRQAKKHRSTGHKLSRRKAMLALGSLAFAATPLSASGKPRLFVFANTDMRARVFEKELEHHLQGVDVTVFGRVRGFMRAASEKPDAILALAPVLETLELKPQLQGYWKGNPTEKYVMLTKRRGFGPDSLSGSDQLGVVNIVGRKDMPRLVTSVLGVQAPRLEYVTHERDLLSLLRFDAVAAVVTSARWANALKAKSEMDLYTTPLPKELGLPAVAFASDSARQEIGQMLRSSSAIRSRLGVDQWR